MSSPKHLCKKCWEKKCGPIEKVEGVTTVNTLTCEECGQKDEFTILDCVTTDKK